MVIGGLQPRPRDCHRSPASCSETRSAGAFGDQRKIELPAKSFLRPAGHDAYLKDDSACFFEV
jgi:hypothetical protein